MADFLPRYLAFAGAQTTQSGTGLTSWAVQGAGATVADTAVGSVQVYAPANASKHQYSLITRAAPATPYSISVMIAHVGRGQNNNAINFGWWNGLTGASAKTQMFHHSYGDGLYVTHQNDGFANGATLAVDAGPDGIAYWGTETRFKIRDDGTTVYFYASQDGISWILFYSVAKASGFLGSSGYSNIVLGCDPFSFECYADLLAWIPGTS